MCCRAELFGVRKLAVREPHAIAAFNVNGSTAVPYGTTSSQHPLKYRIVGMEISVN